MTRVLVILPLVMVVAVAMVAEFSANAASRGILLVANKGDQTLGIIDPESGKQVATVAEGGITGHEVIASPDGRFAYVPIYGNSGVGKPGTDGTNLVAIDLATRKVMGSVEFGHGVRPHCPLFGPKDGLLYLTTELDNTVTVIDSRSMEIIGSIPTGKPESHMLAITRDGHYGFTANVGSGTVSVLDMQARKTLDVISVAPVVQRISISVDDRWAFTSDQTKPQLAVIDTKTRKVASWIPLPAAGYGTAPTPDGKWLVIAMSGAKQVAVLNLNTMKVEHTVDVPAAPQEVLIRPDGAVAYVSCDASKKVAEIQTSTWTVSRLIDAGPGADGLAWAQQK
jgi:DNA-binding beta-propeller fold protein YncE